MSYITPSSYIYVLEGVPFDETYQHSIYFTNTTAQYNYFSSKIKYSFNAQSYQRVKRGYCRVQQKADRMYGCNYMMFQNTNYGSKWFYAFILDVEYINDNVSEIHYEIDVLQSWMFRPASGSTEPDSEFQFNRCFIEREHTPTDGIGDNLVPEGLDIGDYKLNTLVPSNNVEPIPSDMSIVVASTSGYMSDQDHTIVDYDGGRWYAGVYSGVRYSAFTSAGDCNDFLEDLASAGKANSILYVFLAPSAFFNLATNTSPYTAQSTYEKPYTTIDGYTPNNNKLFTYPYQLLMVDTGVNVGTFNWEYFSSTSARIKTLGSVVNTGEYIIYPMNYKGQTDNWCESITDKCGTQCCWATDAYVAWMAQNQYTLSAQEKVITRNYVSSSRQAGYQTGTGIGGALTGALNGLNINEGTTRIIPVSGMSSGTLDMSTPTTMSYGGNGAGVSGGLTQAGQGFMNFLDAKAQYNNAWDMLEATKLTASIKPNIPQGSSTNSIRVGAGLWRPRVYNCHIRREFAKIVDGFFDRYGYAVHSFKVPSIRNRPYWTYVKTVDCTIRGNIPNDDATMICSIFNSGITFWTNGSYVGNYSLGDNRGNAPT